MRNDEWEKFYGQRRIYFIVKDYFEGLGSDERSDITINQKRDQGKNSLSDKDQHLIWELRFLYEKDKGAGEETPFTMLSEVLRRPPPKDFLEFVGVRDYHR